MELNQNRWRNPPCDCRECHICAMAGIARPLPVVELPAPEPEPPKPQPAPTLFDIVDAA